MDPKDANLTRETGFFLLGFSDLSVQLQTLISALFLMAYLISLMGNLIIAVITTVDPALDTPMYFFLRNLSILEILGTTVTVPKTLMGSMSQNRHISFMGCAVQMCLFFSFGASNCFILALMALDRYIAICHPLRYTTIMTKEQCLQLASASWIIGFIFSLLDTILAFNLPFCGSREIHHFFCDYPELIKLSCADTIVNELVASTISVSALLVPFLLILISYMFIISKILKTKSNTGRQKSASTCTAHIASVTLFYGTAMVSYLQPKSSASLRRGRVFAVFYIFVTPMLNPMIYSLRNKAVKESVIKTIKKHTF